YLDYAMSVIVARALPDVRDGLKPVHRRILYAMWHDLGLTHDKPHKKSARIVGEVLGKYHPHGDTAVYDAMVRMAQEFSLRYPLVDGQGNFGSVDGDNAAAMRYTEARLAEISNLMLEDLEKETVGWHDNFDSTLLEPDILPAALPNLLINGSSGIAVGMSTNVPPHNLGEVVDALAYVIEHYATIDDITVEQLMQFIQGPDFPTGGILYRYRDDGKEAENTDAIAQGYAQGKSRLMLQAKAHFEEMSRGRMRIVITELPYQTNKVSLLERIADLVRDEKIVGITDLRDESDRTGMRVAIELTRNVDPKAILADLFKYTPLQQTFGMQMLALVDGQPRTLPLKRILHLFVQHREEIVRRRSEFDLKRAQERAHILEGLLRALDLLDEVIQTIRSSQRVDTARANLIKNFGFSEIQAQAILDMQLRRLAALERKKLQDEFKEIKERIADLEELLAHPEKILALIKTDLLALKEKYGDVRRTQIVERTKGTLTTTDLLPDQQVWVTVSADGDLRRQDVSKISPSTLRQLGKGSEVALLTANTRDYLYLFSRDGRCCRVSVHEIPQDGAKKHLSELCKFGRRDTVTAALALPRSGETAGYLFLVTQRGLVKRITLVDFLAAAHIDPTVIGVDDRDRLGWVFATGGSQEVMLVSGEGQAIRFDEGEVRPMGLLAAGVGGMKIKQSDAIVYAAVIEPDSKLVTMTAQGYAKRSGLVDYPAQGRNGGGVVTHKLTGRTGNVVSALLVKAATPEAMVITLTRKGVARPVALTEIPVMGRSALGKVVVEIVGSDPIAVIKQLGTALQPPGPAVPPD
ncbi:MAG: DNA gyrase subunit A, partial [Chloroflexota bacterium]|nr:DNA gyrase subunit A [Chloroflexota bacterium]